MNQAKFLVTLVRHGETFMNSQRLLQGHSDDALSEKGIQQATNLGRSLATTEFTRAFASDLQRAYNTAKLILSQLKTSPPELIQEKILRERSYGDAEGKTVQEVIKLATEANFSIHTYIPNGAESPAELAVRVSEFFHRLCKLSEDSTSPYENVLIVTHGGWINGLMRFLPTANKTVDLVNFSPADANRIHYNTGVTIFSITPRYSEGAVRYELSFQITNDSKHLSADLNSYY